MTIVTQKDIKEMNDLYLKLKTYAAVSRATGFSPATVKKYIIKDYQPVEEKNIKRYEGDLPEFDPTIFRKGDWGDLCVLSEEELTEVEELWGELDL